MNVEQLTKSQIILLVLLVSFVTSIATGIVTVALVDQTPMPITQSVSRVIQETIENATAPQSKQSAAVETAVVAQQPTLSQAVAEADRSLVRLFGGDPAAPVFLGYGFVLDRSGTVVADYDELDGLESASMTFSGGGTAEAQVTMRDKGNGLAYLSLRPDASSTLQYTPASLAPSEPSIGETVVALSGRVSLRIAPGFVVSLAPGPAPAIVAGIDAASIGDGSPLVNEQGQIVGISTGVSRAIDPAAFMPASVIDLHSGQASSTPATGT